MTDHCSPFCPFLACPTCPYQGGKQPCHTSVVDLNGAAGLPPVPRLTRPTLTKGELR